MITLFDCRAIIPTHSVYVYCSTHSTPTVETYRELRWRRWKWTWWGQLYLRVRPLVRDAWRAFWR